MVTMMYYVVIGNKKTGEWLGYSPARKGYTKAQIRKSLSKQINPKYRRVVKFKILSITGLKKFIDKNALKFAIKRKKIRKRRSSPKRKPRKRRKRILKRKRKK